MPHSPPQKALFCDPSSMERPLCVDFDGTLKSLAFRPELLEALREAHKLGRKLVLVCSAEENAAKHLADGLALFDEYQAGGDAQLPKAKRLAAAYGDKCFDFVGDAMTEIEVFESACLGYVIGASAKSEAAAKRLVNLAILTKQPHLIISLIKQLRPHQWAKNALLFLPVLLAPQIPSLYGLTQAVVAMVAFSFSASAGYVFNDLLDVDADRMHATKCNRPFASGALPTAMGPPLFVALLVASVLLSWWLLPLTFLIMLALYFFGTLSYSLYFKRWLMLDVLVLAALYTHRILAGGIATGVKVSTWLLGFSMFLFTSLAFAKRYVELQALKSTAQVRNRGYFRADLEMVASMGTSSGFIAALVFMLYVDSSKVRVNYRDPSLLWLVLPILLYWLGRVWLLAGRGQMRDDPVKFALRDRTSLACAAAIALVSAAARYSPGWISSGLH